MTVTTEAFVIKKFYCGDFDRIYLLLTEELGKISALAKSSSKINSKLSPHLENLSLTTVMLATGSAGYRLAGAKIKSANKNLIEDLIKLSWSSLFLETIDHLLISEENDKEVFNLTKNFFKELESASSNESAQIIFNKNYFELLLHFGYKPELKARKQNQLTAEMVKIVETATDKKINSFEFLNKISK